MASNAPPIFKSHLSQSSSQMIPIGTSSHQPAQHPTAPLHPSLEHTLSLLSNSSVFDRHKATTSVADRIAIKKSKKLKMKRSIAFLAGSRSSNTTNLAASGASTYNGGQSTDATANRKENQRASMFKTVQYQRNATDKSSIKQDRPETPKKSSAEETRQAYRGMVPAYSNADGC